MSLHSSTAPPVVDAQKLSKTYPGPPEVRALSNINLTISRGEYLAVRGPSGSGKSTLLNLLGLLDSPTGGQLNLNGIPTQELNENERTALRGHEIGFVFQDFQLLSSYTTAENVALGQLYTGFAHQDRLTHALEKLAQVGLSHRCDALSSTLSGGEKQRVAIARALMGNPALLLCDEPTGNLDSHNSAQILDLIDDLHAAGATIVVITHDQSTADRAERSLTIRDGIMSAEIAVT